MSDTKTVELVPNKELLMVQRNKFQKEVIDFVIDLKRHEDIKKVDPNYETLMQNGKYQTVDQKIEIYKENLNNSSKYLKIVDELLTKDEAGTLSDEWKPEEKTEEAPIEEAPAAEQPAPTPAPTPAPQA